MPANDAVLNEPHVAGFAPIETTDWVVVVHAAKSGAFSAVRAVFRIGLIATLADILLIIVFGAILGRNTATVIDRLTAKTQRMKKRRPGLSRV